MSRSVRMISSTWYHSVWVFSNRKVRWEPACRRRRSFSRMNRGRRMSRTRAHSSKLRSMLRLIFFISRSLSRRRGRNLVGKAVVVVGARENFQRMERADAGGLFDLDRGERAIAHHYFRFGVAHSVEGLRAPLHRELEVLFLHRPGAVVRGTGVHGDDLGARDGAHHVARAKADLLRLQMTRDVIGDLPRSGAELAIEAAL